MNEGVKVLYRFALAVLDHHKDALLKTTTAKEFKQVLSSYTCHCSGKFDALVKVIIQTSLFFIGPCDPLLYTDWICLSPETKGHGNGLRATSKCGRH